MEQPTASRGPGRPRGSRSGATREALLGVASRVFAESGFRGSSLGQVAEQAGITTAGLLHHFGSKQALLAEVLRHRDEVDGESLHEGNPDPVGFEVIELLVPVVELNIERAGMVRLYATMSGEAIDPEHPGHEWLADHLEAVHTEIVEGLRRGIAAGTVRPEAPVDVIARVVIAVLDGLQVQWLMDPESVDMVAATTETLAALRCRWEVHVAGRAEVS